jgi:hypothetical protein
MEVLAVKVPRRLKRQLKEALTELGYANSQGRILRKVVEQATTQLVDQANELRRERGQPLIGRVRPVED